MTPQDHETQTRAYLDAAVNHLERAAVCLSTAADLTHEGRQVLPILGEHPLRFFTGQAKGLRDLLVKRVELSDQALRRREGGDAA